MKKIMSLSALLLSGLMAFTGCSCSNRGVYKFDSLEITSDDETKTYKCTDEEKEDAGVAFVCSMFEGITYELKKDGVVTATMEVGDEAESKDGQYKIEDDKFMTRENDEEEWEESGTVSKGKLVLEIAEMGIKVTLKK